jgi:hypothetical protein
VVSFAESLAFLSLLVPGWAVMVGAGALAGSGMLDPWPVIVGAIFGDSLSPAAPAEGRNGPGERHAIGDWLLVSIAGHVRQLDLRPGRAG